MLRLVLPTSLLLVCLIFILTSCNPDSSDPRSSIDDQGRIRITDRTGESWDITYAIQELGFQIHEFGHGLGRDAIQPLIDPTVLNPGAPGYPHEHELFQMIGVALEGASRGYSIRRLIRHEVVNDSLGETAFVATY